jgi:putative flippase GtrA
VNRLANYLFVRQRHNWILLGRFGLVGASGVIVNLLVLNLVEWIGPYYDDVWIDLPATDFNVRWYHLYVTIAFFVANLWNFQLNRGWTFRSGKHAPWLREYVPFVLVGLFSLALNLLIVTVLLHQHSPLSLPEDVFDGTSPWRNRLTWANLIAIAIVTPVSFATNKVWTFRSVRDQAGGRGA